MNLRFLETKLLAQDHKLWNQSMWVQIIALSLTSCVTFDKLLDLCAPWFLHLICKMRVKMVHTSWSHYQCNELTFVIHVEQYLTHIGDYWLNKIYNWYFESRSFWFVSSLVPVYCLTKNSRTKVFHIFSDVSLANCGHYFFYFKKEILSRKHPSLLFFMYFQTLGKHKFLTLQKFLCRQVS